MSNIEMLSQREELSDDELDAVNGGLDLKADLIIVAKVVVHALNQAGIPIAIEIK